GVDDPRRAADTPANVGVGVTVPGGWLPDDAAHQIAAAAALVWLRRRRAYQPGQPDTDAAELTPLPATVTAVQAAVADQPPPASATTGAVLAALPQGGVRLAGDGAADATRGLLVTRLLTALRDPADEAPVIVTRTALTRLLPAIADAAHAIPGLHVVDTLEQAAALLSPLGTSASTNHVKLSLVVTVESAMTAPSGLIANARVVTLNAEAPLPVWHIDRLGYRTAPRKGQRWPRMCVLDGVAAADLLAVLAQPTAAAADSTTATAPTRANAGAQVKVPRQSSRASPPSSRPQAEAAGCAVQLRVLGRPALLIDGEAVTVRRSAALQILVFLAVHPDGATTTQLAQALWPGLPTHTVTGRVYTTVSDLRAAIRRISTDGVVVHTDDRYHLDSGIDVDLWRLRRAAYRAGATSTARTWRAVIEAYPGDLASGHAWPWLEPLREATRRIVLDAYTEAAAAQTDPRDRLRLLQEAVSVDPYNERLHQLTAEQLDALGNPVAAGELMDSFEQRLHLAGINADDDVTSVG
ncbi:hypothetical protein, partial [Micromonospora aurantiaca (nom. illeg.)]